MPRQLRRMFAYMLMFSKVNDPLQIWEEFRDNFCKDCTLRGLGDILSVLSYNGYNLQAFNLPHQGVIVNGNMVDQIEAIFGKLCSLFQEVITWVSPAIVSKVQTFGMCANNITYSKT